MTATIRLRVTEQHVTGNDNPAGYEVHTFNPGDEFTATRKTGDYWWTCDDTRLAFLVPDRYCDVIYPIFDADRMPHFPCGDGCHMCDNGQPVCYDCGVPWPCATVAEMLVAS